MKAESGKRKVETLLNQIHRQVDEEFIESCNSRTGATGEPRDAGRPTLLKRHAQLGYSWWRRALLAVARTLAGVAHKRPQLDSPLASDRFQPELPALDTSALDDLAPGCGPHTPLSICRPGDPKSSPADHPHRAHTEKRPPAPPASIPSIRPDHPSLGGRDEYASVNSPAQDTHLSPQPSTLNSHRQ
jgi:hypothetical protein